MSSECLELVSYSRKFLELSWDWLNDPEIKELTGTPDFTKEQQNEFFLSLPRDGYRVWGLLFSQKPIGVFGLKNIKSESAEYFGYIGEKEFWGQGLFSYIFDLIKVKCKLLGVNVVYLNLEPYNHRAKNAYLKAGFKINNELSNKDNIRMSIMLDENESKKI